MGTTDDDTPDATTRDRLRGALLGLALGDGVGAPFESRSAVAADEVTTWLDADDQLRWTDDTHMALTLAEVLHAGAGRLDPQRLGDAFAAAYAAEPWRGYGAGPPQVFAMARRGVPYLDAAATLFGGTGSYGNGAAMRAAPAALAAGGDPERTAELAALQARVTHAHPEAVDGAVFVATAVAALASGDGDRGTTATVLLRVADRVPTGAVRDGVDEALGAAERGEDPAATARRLGTGVAARASVPTAVVALLAGHDLVATLRTAVGFGGDTDTIAAMAGAMAGAVDGATAIPTRLVDRLEAAGAIAELATRLVGS